MTTTKKTSRQLTKSQINAALTLTANAEQAELTMAAGAAIIMVTVGTGFMPTYLTYEIGRRGKVTRVR